MAPQHIHIRHGNLTGILAMLGSMAFFVANDTCVKLVGETIPLGELILLRNTSATLYILAFAAIAGGLRLPSHAPRRLLGWRMAAEALSTLTFLTALLAMPIADVTALAQFTPLAITAAAAVVLKEPIGWRRWLAAFAGLIGVMLIARPGTSAFSPATLVLLLAVAFVTARDLLTRQIPASVPTLTLTLMSAAITAPAGLLLAPFETWVVPSAHEGLLLMLCGGFLTLAYALIVVAMRSGDVGAIAPFRYAVILFAILSGWLIWDETPDPVQVLGIVILTLAGLYTVKRERRVLRAPLR
ncbi:MAG TPA: DMT family transporter [Hyphomicrobium sp.]|nr:DMT family transporter [Hyphomicrobium sp.]